MIPVTIERRFIPPKTLVFGIVIGQTKLARPVGSALNPKMIVAVFCQFAIATRTLQNPLPQSDTRRHTMRPHLLHRHKFEGIYILPRAHQLSFQWQQTPQQHNRQDCFETKKPIKNEFHRCKPNPHRHQFPFDLSNECVLTCYF
jgi:hypothetical protein